MNRSIFALIKSRSLLLAACGFAVGLGACVTYTLANNPYKKQCTLASTYFDIKKGNELTMTRGVYRVYRDSLSKGYMTYIGTIARYDEDQLLAPPVPVNRELRFNGHFHDNQLVMTVVSQHRRIGDQSSDKDVQAYVFPQIKPGDSGSSSMFLLDGKVLATGPETVARSVCTN